MTKLSEMTLKQCWYLFMCGAVAFICVGGVSFYPYHLRNYVIIGATIGSFLISLVTEKSIHFNALNVAWLAVTGLLLFSSMISYSPTQTLQFGLMYLVCTLVLFIEFPKSFWNRLIIVMDIFAIVIAVSIIASVFIDNLMLRYFGFIMNPKDLLSTINQITSELNYGAYSGFAGEKADAALVMNVGIAASLSTMLSGKKVKPAEIIKLVIYAIALILTGKRMLFIIPILVFVVLMLISNVRQKAVKLIFFAVLGVMGLLVLSMLVPQLQTMYERFVADPDSLYGDRLTGRGELWSYSWMMFERSPLWGMGYGAFNEFAFDNGYLHYGERWNYFGHNCYYEALGEIGIIGAFLLFALFAAALAVTFRILKRQSLETEQRRVMMFSAYIQMMFFIYCTSANVIYEWKQLYLWFVAIAMALVLVPKRHSRFERVLERRRLEYA